MDPIFGDTPDFPDANGSGSAWDTLAPNIKAGLILLLPFVIADFFNYYSAGAALIISGPVMFLIYMGGGALCAYFALREGRSFSALPGLGAVTGAGLWLGSTVVNTVIGLILGTVSLGATLLLGLPYLCLCAPFNLVGGALVGAFGAWLFTLIYKP
jgi:hypothetical protein